MGAITTDIFSFCASFSALTISASSCDDIVTFPLTVDTSFKGTTGTMGLRTTAFCVNLLTSFSAFKISASLGESITTFSPSVVMSFKETSSSTRSSLSVVSPPFAFIVS